MRISPTGKALGATILGIDLAASVAAADCQQILAALGTYGVLHFPRQNLDAAGLATFGGRFGALEINVANRLHAPDHPEVMILSNIIENGKPVGLADAGQGWHTDLSYSRRIGLASLLHAIKVPYRQARPLGDTQFRDMHQAYLELPAALKGRLQGRTATHDFAKFWDEMRARPGSRRGPLTLEQRRKAPPVSQPIFRTHPITGRPVLYCNPGYAVRIDGMAETESAELLALVFKHQEQEQFFYAHHWSEGDVLMWDNIGTVHRAVADYNPDEPRYMRRVQVMATKDDASVHS
jgi:alpha-ketoglutarate-dependent taurine dioxygenase